MHHEPVLLNEVINLIRTHANKSSLRILDGTLGLGGYSQAILQNFAGSYILGIDRDESAINFSRERLKSFSGFEALHANFGDLDQVLQKFPAFDAFVFDLGVSNMQISLPERGFSFNLDGPLDMRMNQNENSPTAREILQSLDANELAKIFWDYGEERFSRLIASAIKRNKTPLNTTSELVDLIREALPKPVQRKMGTHPARRVFQALRIYINNETGELENLLKSLREINHESIIIFVAYHSLEDRLIKKTFRQWQSENFGKILTRHPITPSESELEANYKSRSAKLRAFLTISN